MIEERKKRERGRRKEVKEKKKTEEKRKKEKRERKKRIEKKKKKKKEKELWCFVGCFVWGGGGEPFFFNE